MDVSKVRNDTKNGDVAELLQNLTPFVKEREVASELVDDDTLHKPALVLREQHDASIDGGEDAAAVYIGNKDDRGLGVLRHGHVHKVNVTQVKL